MLSGLCDNSLSRDVLALLLSEHLKCVAGRLPRHRAGVTTRHLGDLTGFSKRWSTCDLIDANRRARSNGWVGIPDRLTFPRYDWHCTYSDALLLCLVRNGKVGHSLLGFQFVNCLMFIDKRIGILSDCFRWVYASALMRLISAAMFKAGCSRCCSVLLAQVTGRSHQH